LPRWSVGDWQGVVWHGVLPPHPALQGESRNKHNAQNTPVQARLCARLADRGGRADEVVRGMAYNAAGDEQVANVCYTDDVGQYPTSSHTISHYLTWRDMGSELATILTAVGSFLTLIGGGFAWFVIQLKPAYRDGLGVLRELTTVVTELRAAMNADNALAADRGRRIEDGIQLIAGKIDKVDNELHTIRYGLRATLAAHENRTPGIHAAMSILENGDNAHDTGE